MADDSLVLTCWKDIAGYLGKTVRTVQRWERELGMPVHRPKGPSAKVVCALPEELARWIATADPESKPKKPASRGDLRATLTRLETLIEENANLSRRCAATLHDLEAGRSRLTAAISAATQLLAPAASSNGNGARRSAPPATNGRHRARA